MYYRDLEVWKKSIKLVKEVYYLVNEFPDDEKYGLTSQIKRAVVSIPSNIAEGASRYSDKESCRFIDIALGSIAEVETQIIIAKELGFVENIDVLMDDSKELYSMLLGLKKFYNKWTCGLAVLRSCRLSNV